jgi:hypothetical protein
VTRSDRTRRNVRKHQGKGICSGQRASPSFFACWCNSKLTRGTFSKTLRTRSLNSAPGACCRRGS